MRHRNSITLHPTEPTDVVLKDSVFEIPVGQCFTFANPHNPDLDDATVYMKVRGLRAVDLQTGDLVEFPDGTVYYNIVKIHVSARYDYRRYSVDDPNSWFPASIRYDDYRAAERKADFINRICRHHEAEVRDDNDGFTVYARPK